MSSFVFYLVGFLVISNPIGSIPVFCSLTQGRSAESRHRIARVTGVTAFIVMLTSLLAGKSILAFFGISEASFRVAGGLLILLMALSMMRGESVEKGTIDSMDDREIGITPMALPLTAGPGAISTAILFADSAASSMDYLLITAAALVASLFIWASLRLSGRIREVVGETGIHVITRLMGLLLAAIAVEFITEGLTTTIRSYW